MTEAGAIVYTLVPAFFTQPTSLENMVDHTLEREFDLFEIELNLVRRWTGEMHRPKAPVQALRQRMIPKRAGRFSDKIVRGKKLGTRPIQIEWIGI